MKHRLLAGAERAVNAVTRLINLRVILAPESTFHGEPVSFRADGLVGSHTANFLEDAKFLQVLESIRAEIRHPLYHVFRAYIAVQLAQIAREVPGVFVECGVGEGVMSLAINRYLDRVPDTFLIDTFAGIDAAQLQASELHGLTAEGRRDHALRSYPTSDVDSIRRRFAAYPNVHLVEGSIPSVLAINASLFTRPVSWLHIDMNSAAPEVAALKFFYPRMATPGFVLFDDYAFKGLRAQKDAIDAACREMGIAIPISLPTGQGLLVKSH